MACVGLLALQGDFAAHEKVLAELGVASKLVKKPADLDGIQGLIIPGGESTTLLKLMAPVAMRPALEQFHTQGRPIFGTCAGLILLAQETLPPQESLGFIDIVAERNAYGRQIDSFVALGTSLADDLSAEQPLEMVFIRAPKIARIDSGVTPLAECKGEVVMARQGSVLVSSFHPELTQDRRVHQYFLQMLAAG